MTTYNFDKITNRKGTNCLKYDYAVERGKPADVLPLWVADMDFTVSDEITKSLYAAVDHGIYGYTQPKDAYYNAITNWMEKGRSILSGNTFRNCWVPILKSIRLSWDVHIIRYYGR